VIKVELEFNSMERPQVK